MLTAINPKLPMRDKTKTKEFYINKLGFKEFGNTDFEHYLMLQKILFKFIFLNLKDLILKKIMVRFTSELTILTPFINYF